MVTMIAQRIAIDGPAGSGKTTVGTRLATDLEYIFVDAGSLYRIVTLEALHAQLEVSHEAAVTDFMQTLEMQAAVTRNQQVQFQIGNSRSDSISNLHTPEINQHVPIIAAYPEVRNRVRQLQAEIAQHKRIVFAGRDIGTVVMPNADLKIFLNVSLGERVNRRYHATRSTHPALSWQEIYDDILRRDGLDSSRIISPMRPAEDAICLETDTMTIDQVLNTILYHAHQTVMSSESDGY